MSAGMEQRWLPVHLRARDACEEPSVRRSWRCRQCDVKRLGCVVIDPKLVLDDRVGSSAPSTVRCREVSDPASSRFLRKNCFFRMEAGKSSHAGMTMVCPGAVCTRSCRASRITMLRSASPAGSLRCRRRWKVDSLASSIRSESLLTP